MGHINRKTRQFSSAYAIYRVESCEQLQCRNTSCLVMQEHANQCIFLYFYFIILLFSPLLHIRDSHSQNEEGCGSRLGRCTPAGRLGHGYPSQTWIQIDETLVFLKFSLTHSCCKQAWTWLLYAYIVQLTSKGSEVFSTACKSGFLDPAWEYHCYVGSWTLRRRPSIPTAN